MNLSKYLKLALPYDVYVSKLGDNLQLHNLHYKKFSLDEAQRNEIAQFNGYNIIVLTEPWCGDSLAAFPVLKKMSEAGNGWNLKILLRDHNPEFIDKFLTDGTRSIPLFFFLDYNGNLIFKWGPRTKAAQQIFKSNRQLINTGKISKEDVLRQLRYFYAKDRGQHIHKELMELLRKHQKKNQNRIGNKLLTMEVI